MRSIVALLSCHSRRRRLKRASERAASVADEVVWADDLNDFRRRCEAIPAGFAVVDPYGSRGTLELTWCRTIGKLPFVIPVAYADFADRPPRDLIRLGESGFREAVADRGGDEIRDLVKLFRDPPASASIEAVLGAWEEASGRAAHPAVERVLIGAREPLSPASLSRALHCSRWTLGRRLRQDRLPTPNRLIIWGRLLVAGWLLEYTDWSFERVATHLGYASPNHLRNQLRLYASARPSELRTSGTVERLAEALRMECQGRTTACEKRPAA